MTLSKKVQIRYTVDARGAKRGLEAMKKGNDAVRDATKEATARVREFDKATKESSKQLALKSRLMQQMTASAGGLKSSIGALTASMGGPAGLAAVVTGGALALGELASKADELAARSMQLTAVFANVPIPIEAARRQTRGLVTDFDLARLASDAVSLGITDNAKKFADLSEALQKLGARRGIDALKSIEDGVSAIGRNSTELLDNLGVSLKAAQAQEEYAKSLGKTAKELSDVEKAEAFREVATRKVIEAAKGVTIDTDSAAAAVRRLNVELQNIEDRALGGEVATLGLREGLRQIQKDGPLNLVTLQKYEAEAANLRITLRDLGVASEDIPEKVDDLAKAARSAALDVKSLRFEEQQRQKALEKNPAYKAEQARLAAEKESLETARLRIREIEDEQAFLTHNNDRIADKAKLQIESLQLQAKIVRATGDEAKAREIERQAELAQYAELSRIANLRRNGGRGGKRDPYKSERLTFQQQLTEAINAERAREFANARTLQRGYLGDVRKYQAELAQVRLPENERQKQAIANLERQRQLELDATRRQIELAQANGDPATAFALQQERFAVEQAALEEKIRLENDVAQKELLANDLAQVRHEQEISRIDEARRLREAAAQGIVNSINAVSAAERGAVTLSSTIASAAIKGEKRKKKALDAIKATGLYADGAVSIAQGGIALAAGNIPQGLAQIAAGANAIAQGTIIAAGNAGPGGARRGGGSTAGTATQFARGTAPERAQFNVERGAPISVREDIEGNVNNTGQSGAGSSGARVINIQRIDVLGSIDDDSANKIRRGLQRAEANLGR